MRNIDGISYPRNAVGASLWPLGVVAVAVLLGALAAVTGSAAGSRALYYIGLPALALLGLAIAATRAEPLRFLFLALIAVLPMANFAIPPGRLRLTAFDVATVALTLGFLLRNMFATSDVDTRVFPARSLALIWLLLLPCAILARYPVQSTLALALLFCAYVFFLFLLQELRRAGGPERVFGLLCVAVIIVVAGLCLDHYLHVNLSFGSVNPNQVSRTADGTTIWRAGGFFQDPQKAGGFLAASMGFLLVLGIRGRFRGTWLQTLLWIALLAGVPGLMMTVSRAAMLSFVVVSAMALLLLSNWPAMLRMLGIGAMVVVMTLVFLTPDLLVSMLPDQLAARMGDQQADWEFRKTIWFDTWDMFANQPLTGIGFGAFQHYLLDTRPMVFSYYGIGESTGTIYVPDQPESGYFKILYEGGILGSLAALILIVETLRRAGAGMLLHKTHPHARTEIAAALAGLIALSFTFAAQFTLGDARILVLLLIMMAVIWRHTLPDAAEAAAR
ncbi:MAG TPA: O-antigen ligase family protein [Steroidobacteraceae bacterium]|nr:O-antigen ligase family protein [Steroidobacteraceae bacterium]